MKSWLGLGACLALFSTMAVEAQTLGGLRLGDSEGAAIIALGPGHRSKPISGRPGASVLLGKHLSVTVCRGVISGLRVSRPGNFLSYASLVQSEAHRLGLGQTTISHSSSVQDIAIATTIWRKDGVATQYELVAMGNAGASVEMIALEYNTIPDPCPKAE